MQLQRMSSWPGSGCTAAAAQVAATQADALLDSIQMPSLHKSTALSAVIVDASSSSSSEGSGDDESDAEQGVKAKSGPTSLGMGKESVSS